MNNVSSAALSPIRRAALLSLLAWGVIAAPDLSAQDRPAPLSLAQARQAIEVREGYRVELVASEPLIADPVSVRLDHRGRLWVVEMPDYPLGPVDGDTPNGRIKILSDTDNDGQFDSATLFADQLWFATGVQPYRDGAFVTLAGKIVQMRDTDDDGVADQTIELFKGFAAQNQQLRANHPTLGPDGLIYVANGLRGGSVQSLTERYPARDQPLDLRDRDFCFDPEGEYWGAVAGKSQFGLTIDDYGRRFGCSNRNPAMMTPLNLDQVDRDPLLAARDAIHDVAAAAEKSKVVSRGQAWTTSNLHSGQFSAACGVFAPGITDDQGEWLAVCEPTAYLVQRQRLRPSGSVWTATREPLEAEFVASSDSWFRPVDLAAGPGQSLFVVDMARAVIEHPDFMPPELKTRPDLRDGTQLGRIWHVVPEGVTVRWQTLQSSEQALQWLSSDSPWQRAVAGQFLLEQESIDEKAISQFVRSSQTAPRARARSAWLLARRDRLQSTDWRALATAQQPRLRALAIRLAGDAQQALPIVMALAGDADEHVRREAATWLAAREVLDEQPLQALASIATASDDSWIERTLASVEGDLVHPLAVRIASEASSQPHLLAHWIQRLSIDAPMQSAEVLAQIWQDRQAEQRLDAGEVQLLEGFLAGLRRGRHSPAATLGKLPPQAAQSLTTMLAAAGHTALEHSAAPPLRARCLALAAGFGRVPENVSRLLNVQTPTVVRAAAISLALAQQPQTTRDYLQEHLAAMPIALRTAALAACTRNKADLKWLLDQIAAENLPRTVIDPATADRLKQHADAEIKQLAQKLLQSDSNRARVLAAYAPAAAQLGDPHRGKKLFLEHCAACHQIDGQGTNVGPDISDTRTKTADALLASILDPNAAIDSSFIQYRILTIDGRILDGLLIDETAQAITLQQKGDERVSVPREEIESVQAPGVSLMPEGFEQSLDVTAMSHLLAYLKNWRYLQTQIPGTLSP